MQSIHDYKYLQEINMYGAEPNMTYDDHLPSSSPACKSSAHRITVLMKQISLPDAHQHKALVLMLHLALNN